MKNCIRYLFFGLLFVTQAYGNGPTWWTTRGVINTNANSTNDFAAANAGQLKWLALNAKEELDAKLPGGCGVAVSNLVNGLVSSNDFAAINAGQLKNIAQPFYDRLIAVGYTNTYPWPTGATNVNDYAVVNVGQVKNMFCFDLEGFFWGPDTDGDGMSDPWELHYFGDLSHTAIEDSDNDGLCNLAEFLNRTHPVLADTDGDGILDKWELDYGLNPRLNDAYLDADGDGVVNIEEFRRGTDPARQDAEDVANTLNLKVFLPL